MLAGILRVAATGLLARYRSADAAEDFLHATGGVQLYMACAGLLLLLIWWLGRRTGSSMAASWGLSWPATNSPAQTLWRLPASPPLWSAVFLIAALLLVSLLVSRPELQIPERQRFAFFPPQLGDWKARRAEVDPVALASLKLADHLSLVWQRPADPLPVSLWVAWYDLQIYGASVHSPMACLPGAGWRVETLGSRSIPPHRPGAEALRVNRAIIALGDERQLVYYWFAQRGRVLGSEYLLKWYIFQDSLLMQRSDGGLVRLTTPLPDLAATAEADARLAALTQLLRPLLDAYVPGADAPMRQPDTEQAVTSPRCQTRQNAPSLEEMTVIPMRTLLAVAVLGLLAACASPEEKAAAYVAKAQKLYDAGDYEQASLEVRNAAQVEPKNAKARYLMALLAEQKEDYKGMFNHLLVAVDADPANVEARLKLGMVFVVISDWESVAEQSDALLKLAPEDARVVLLQARVDLQNGNLSAGRAGLEKSMQLDPDNSDPVLILGALEGAEDLDRGLAILDAGIARMPPENAKPLREQRILLLAQGKRHQGGGRGAAALTKDYPDDSSYPEQLARIYVGQGRLDDADKVYQQLIDLNPADAERRIAYVGFLVGQQQADKAEKFLQTSIAAYPDNDVCILRWAISMRPVPGRMMQRRSIRHWRTRSPKSADGVKGAYPYRRHRVHDIGMMRRR